MARVGSFWRKIGDAISPAFTGGVDLLISGTNRYINFKDTSGDTGYGIRDNAGVLQFKNEAGVWTNFGAGGGGGAVDSVNGQTGVVVLDAGDVGAIPTSEKGANNGVAELDAGGKVPSSQLPSFVDDVIEVANFSSLPGTGATGVIYVTLDDNKTYRWSGSAYVEISASLALGETSATAYRGDRGKVAYDYSQVGHVPLAGGTMSGDLSVPDEAYGPGWNGSSEVPTKNALYDKIELLGGGITEAQVRVIARRYAVAL